jgi:hypothetical protein
MTGPREPALLLNPPRPAWLFAPATLRTGKFAAPGAGDVRAITARF